MESSQIYESVGGITRVVIYPAGAPLPEAVADEQEELSSDAHVVPLMERSAKYIEQWSCRNTSRVVTHTLSYTTRHGVEQWSERQIEAAIRRGVVADVTLASGAKIRVGWSAKHGDAFALRLQSVNFESGSQPTDVPQKTWVWESSDTTPLL